MYNDAQIEFIKTELKDFLYFFGYVEVPDQKMSKTAFFKYENSTEEDLKKFNQYKKHN